MKKEVASLLFSFEIVPRDRAALDKALFSVMIGRVAQTACRSKKLGVEQMCSVGLSAIPCSALRQVDSDFSPAIMDQAMKTLTILEINSLSAVFLWVCLQSRQSHHE